MIKKFAQVSPCCICGGNTITRGCLSRGWRFKSRTILRGLCEQGIQSQCRYLVLGSVSNNNLDRTSTEQRSDKDTRILKSHCDLCNDELPKEADNIQYRINVLDEIDNSFESEYDKHGNQGCYYVPFVARSTIFQVILSFALR